jgi:hypothetical protein
MSNPNELKPQSEPAEGPDEDAPEVPEFATKLTKTNYGKVDFSKSQGIRFYANHVATAITLFEIRLVLSDVDLAGDGVAAVQTVTVLMSPELAKLTHGLLGQAIENYTASHGKLRLPERADLKNKTEPPR